MMTKKDMPGPTKMRASGAHIRTMRAVALVAAALAAAAAGAPTTGDDTERLPQLRRWTEDNGGWLS